MRNIPLRFWVLASILVAVNVAGWLWVNHASGDLPRVRLLAVTPTDDVDQADRFTFTFDEPMVEGDRLAQPVETPPFEIKPAVAGRWQWAHPDQLVFLLEEKLPPGNQWQIKPAAQFESTLRRKLAGESEFTFQTLPLALGGTPVTAIDRTHVTVDLKFNQAVNPADVLRLLSASDLDREATLAFETLSKEPVKRIAIRVARPAGTVLVLKLDESLTGHVGNLPLGRSVERMIDLGKRFRLVDIDVARPSVKPTLSVWLRFSRSLDSKQALPRISVKPPVENLRILRNGNYIKLTGPFRSGSRYEATIPSTLLSRDGQTLGDAATTSFEIGERRPELSIPVGRGMLMPDGNLLIDMKVVNVKAFNLNAYRVHTNNLVAHLRGESQTVTGRKFVEREIELKSKLNEPQDIAIDLRQLLEGANPGVYAIEARAQKPYWLRERAVIAITNFAITAKQQRGGYHVWVTSLRDGKPVQGAAVTAMTYNNQSIRDAVTDANGFAQLDSIDDHPDGAVWLITAQKNHDVSYIRPDRRKWVLDTVDQSGREHPTTYDAMIYTERGIYRPGDTVHVTGVLREPDGQTPPAMPLELRVQRPDGRVLPPILIPPSANAQSLFHADFPTGQDWQTGRYKFEIGIPGTEKTIGETTALIEAFVPVRLEVNAKPSKERFGADEPVAIDIDARYLFGQPAATLPVKVSPTLRRIAFKSKAFANYKFDDGDGREKRLQGVNQTLDEQGKATTKIDLPGSDRGLWKVDAVATVTEIGGRSVSASTSAIVDTVDRHVGLNLKADKFILIGRPTSLAWCVVNAQDEPVEGDSLEPLVLKVERLESQWYLEEVNGTRIWKVRRNATTVIEREVEAGSANELTFECEQPGSHRLTLRTAKTKASSQIEFFAVERASEWNNVATTTPERLRIEIEREDYQPGETARVVVHSPFKGTLMLTVETDRVVHGMTLPMVENTAVIDLPVDRTLRGGAYMSATVVRAIDPQRKQWLPHRAMGIARLRTNHDHQKPAITLVAPTVAEPGETVEIAASVQGTAASTNGMLHLWAVDDGILMTTGFQTPDLHKHYFASRRGFVTTSDTFADLMPDHARPNSMLRIGGDGGKDEFEAELAMRRNPIPSKQRTPAVVWNRAVPVGADGQIRVPMTMPKMTGRMRVMAVYVSDDHYASQEANITLTSSLVAEWTWPRFAAPGDQFDVPVKLFNTTKEPLDVTVNMIFDGPIEASADGDSMTLNLKPGESIVQWQRITATGLGRVDAKLHAEATSPTHGKILRAENVVSLSVRPTAPLHTHTQLVRAEVGKPFDVTPSDEIQAKTGRLQLHISGNPAVQLRPAVEQLLDYPYGCVEQTTSRLMAIVHAHELIALDQPNDARIGHAREMVSAGIARLWSMQTTSGGLAYWPGNRTPTLWGTAYAASFLVVAKASGFEVDKQFVTPLMKYLAAKLKTTSNDKELDDNTRALLVRVLATFDQPDHGWMARLSERVKHLDIAGRAHLAAAWHAIGRKDKAASLLLDDTLAKNITTTTSNRLTSQVAQEATLLKVLLELNPSHAWIPKLVLKLNASRKQGMWGTTVSNAAAIGALSAYQATQSEPSQFIGQIIVDGKPVAQLDHQHATAFSIDDLSKPISITTSGKGNVFVTTTTRGFAREGAIKPYDNNLQVRRRWHDRHDKPIDPSKLKVGDLIFVTVELEAKQLQQHESIDNIAVVDALPAGMEVENPRLMSSATGNRDGDRADRVEFLDDRVVLFASATGKKKSFKYALRVVTKGQFAVPPIQASCMYDPAIASLAQAGVMQVAE